MRECSQSDSGGICVGWDVVQGDGAVVSQTKISVCDACIA